MIFARTVAPTVRPVEVGDVMEHLRVTGDDEQQLVSSLIDAAIAYLDGPMGILGRCIMTQTWRVEIGAWPEPEEWVLPVSPVQSVVVQYRDSAGVWQTMTAGTQYDLMNRADGATVILPPWNGDWPTAGDYRYPIRADVVAGDALPNQAIRGAMLMLIGHWFQNREAAGEVSMTNAPLSFHALIEPLRRIMAT